MVILDPYGMIFDAVNFFGSGVGILFKSVQNELDFWLPYFRK